MLLRRAPLLLLCGMLGSWAPGGRCGSPRHSLRFSYLRVSESSRGDPQFHSVILLDDQPIARNHKHTSGTEFLVPWMGAEEKTILVDLEGEIRDDLEQLSDLSHQTEGLHTWQAILGCELREDGSKGGFLNYSYDGMDFISFDKETLRWVAAQPQAQKVKEKWDNEPWRSNRSKVYLEEMCFQMMPNQMEFLNKRGSPRHSLRFSYLRVSESSRGDPQFHSVILLDDQPIARYDNHTSRMELLVPWMGAEQKKILVALEREFRADLEQLSDLSHQTEGLHTWQAILGCELREDGSKGGCLHYGYNGMDFISFDKETLRWVAAQPQAQKVKEEWDYDPRRSQRNTVYIDMCIKKMQKYLPYQEESLKKTEPPVGKVNSKVVDDSLEVLICQAFGFYPKEIQAIWTREGEACVYETLHRNVVPNSDGTYYVQLSIEIDPKERHRFRCHLEHEGLQEPLDLALKEETAGVWRIVCEIVAAVVAVIMVLSILFWACSWKRLRRKFCHVEENLHLPEINHSPSTDSTEDETQSQELP